MPRTKPPFRADHVGSLLRSVALKAARGKRERGEISAAELAAVEDREIEKVIRKQEDVGLRSVTDGEFRRAFWNYDFLGKLNGVEAYLGERKIKFQGRQPKPMMLRVVGKLGAHRAHPMIEHFKFVAAHAKATPKMTIPSPSSLHFRYGRDAVPASTYPAMEDFYRDLGRATGRWCAPSQTPAAATSSSTRSTSPISAIRSCARSSPSAATTRRCCRTSMPA